MTVPLAAPPARAPPPSPSCGHTWTAALRDGFREARRRPASGRRRSGATTASGCVPTGLINSRSWPRIRRAPTKPRRREVLELPALRKCERGDLNPHGCYPTGS
jgi:hypothetical protein